MPLDHSELLGAEACRQAVARDREDPLVLLELVGALLRLGGEVLERHRTLGDLRLGLLLEQVAVEVAADVDGGAGTRVTLATGVVGGDRLVVRAQDVAVGVRRRDGGADSGRDEGKCPGNGGCWTKAAASAAGGRTSAA